MGKDVYHHRRPTYHTRTDLSEEHGHKPVLPANETLYYHPSGQDLTESRRAVTDGNTDDAHQLHAYKAGSTSIVFSNRPSDECASCFCRQAKRIEEGQMLSAESILPGGAIVGAELLLESLEKSTENLYA